MKKPLYLLGILVLFFLCAVPASAAVTNGMVKVGLRYGGTAMASANLENTSAGGFSVGYYDESRQFVSQGTVDATAITMVPSGGGVAVTATSSGAVLYTGNDGLALVPNGGGPVWFRGNRYAGGFEYRLDGGALAVINVVTLEEYVKGVLPYEMPGHWPEEALKAQAVCARTFVCRTIGHPSHGFDVCGTIDCQVYSGLGNGSKGATEATDRAVDATAGQCLYYEGALIQASYHSSNGGATEDGEIVWGGSVPYLKGKLDPYETDVPNYSYTVTYTPAELTWVLQNSGYSIGTVKDVYVSGWTEVGNVAEVTFTDTSGKTLKVHGEACRMAFYSSTYNKNVRSLRFTIAGGSGGAGLYVNDTGSRLPSLDGAAMISGGGTVSIHSGSGGAVITSAGVEALEEGAAGSGGAFTITGTGNGHNVGLSQYGAKGMAEQGFSWQDILNFYYTGVDIH